MDELLTILTERTDVWHRMAKYITQLKTEGVGARLSTTSLASTPSSRTSGWWARTCTRPRGEEMLRGPPEYFSRLGRLLTPSAWTDRGGQADLRRVHRRRGAR